MEGAYTQAIQVELVHALLERLKLDKVSVMGISYGSEVALQLALAYPTKVEKLILFNATAATGPWLKDIGDAWNKASVDGEGYYLTTIPVIYSPEFYKKNKEWMDRRREILVPVFSNPAFSGSMVRLTRSAEGYDVRDQLSKISAPTLVVSSQQDYLTPVEEQVYIAAHIPRCDHVIIPGCGHASMYEKPVLFTSVVLGFVNNSKNSYSIN
ncbi:2-hydroxymuconate semialdehyde hydrolase [bioreactor metagenome]|uniref:2-hydroxymuconate semialdehyde hydrolase n=1 Tax=bioreactor metagenome TaxID=1076179 RepID=A0A645BLQ4_9ZZZZ